MTQPIPLDLLIDLRRQHETVRLYGRDSDRYVTVADLIDEIARYRDAARCEQVGRGD